jgi:hypothetical protein
MGSHSPVLLFLAPVGPTEAGDSRNRGDLSNEERLYRDAKLFN